MNLECCQRGFNNQGTTDDLRVLVQTKKMANVNVLRIFQEIIEVALAGRSRLPFSKSAFRSITVVVNCCRPTRDNLQTSVSIVLDGTCQWPKAVYLCGN